MFIAQAMCGVESKSSCLVLQLQSAEYLKHWSAALNEDGLSVLMLMKGSKIPTVELNKFTYNSIIHYSCTINCSTLDMQIIACMCGLPNSPA